MEKTLKIYVIEDHVSRRDEMKKYFDNVNKLLNGNGIYDKNSDFENCQLCFQNNQYKKVELIPILPRIDDKGVYNDYQFGKNRKWVKEIEKILKEKEERIFLIDFALNAKERECLRRNSACFIAYTTRKIMDLINNASLNKEYIIFETVVKNAKNNSRGILNIGMTESFDKLCYKFMLGDYFSSSQSVYEKVNAISYVFEEIFNEMKGGI